MARITYSIHNGVESLLRQVRSSSKVPGGLVISISSTLRTYECFADVAPTPKVGKPTKVSETTSRLIARKMDIALLCSTDDALEIIQSAKGGKVMYSDESDFCGFQPFERNITTKYLNDAYLLPGGIGTRTYMKILGKDALESRNWHDMDPATFIFQHDNTRVHIVRIIKDNTPKAKANVLERPTNSSGLNVIKRIWAYISKEFGDDKL
ncbi:hypothetical protein BX616_002858 [Lobosporangium transversale]|nr:hypothetical protein BX616_002858 [Lobosporangium transversale]